MQRDNNMPKWALAAAVAMLANSGPSQGPWYPSRYGPTDTLGAIGILSTDSVRNALRLARRGKVYSLAIPTGPDTPISGNGGRSYQVQILQIPPADQPARGENKFTALDDRLSTAMGIGTQIDGLAHVGIDRKVYNGRDIQDLLTPTGLRVLDLSNLPPIVTRGVVIDMAGYFGVTMLAAGKAFDENDIKAAARRQGITIKRGDVVLFYTGWMKQIAKAKAIYQSSEPGINVSAAQWLADRGVVAVGADTIAVEAKPFPEPNRPYSVHQTLLAKNGVYILECVDTSRLVADRVNEFLFVLGPPRLVGTVQLIVNPLAIT